MDISDIENALARPLPGSTAQYLMAPAHRLEYTHEEVMTFSPKIGGVLLLIHPKEEGPAIIFTLRKQYPGTHSGQMSFPGGKREAADIDITQTALRETQEEIGVTPDDVRVIGRLSELYIPPSNFLVYPTVGVLTQEVVFVKQENEVEEIIEIPLDFFTDRRNRSTAKIKVVDSTEVEVPAFIYGPYVIWGATAIMMSEFVYIVNSES